MLLHHQQTSINRLLRTYKRQFLNVLSTNKSWLEIKTASYYKKFYPSIRNTIEMTVKACCVVLLAAAIFGSTVAAPSREKYLRGMLYCFSF